MLSTYAVGGSHVHIYEPTTVLQDFSSCHDPHQFHYMTPTQSPSSLFSAVMESSLHPLLRYSQHDIVPGNCAPILWDLRESPGTALHVDNPDKQLSPFDLSQPATTPPCFVLHISCDVFPEPWPIEVSRPEAVTVGDVLHAIHSVISRRITQSEWDRLSDKQRARIGARFDDRCKLSPQREECRANGVLRVDCILAHTLFAGLSTSHDEDDSFIMTLRRPQ